MHWQRPSLGDFVLFKRLYRGRVKYREDSGYPFWCFLNITNAYLTIDNEVIFSFDCQNIPIHFSTNTCL